jgi:hypothetical protein
VRIDGPKVNFAPGVYHVHLGIRSAASSEDHLKDACSFEIMPVHDPRWPQAERLSGMVRQDARFSKISN